MKKTHLILISILLLAVLLVTHFNANNVVLANNMFEDFTAKSYIVVDHSGKVLVENNSEAKREVASICKLMTTLITLENIESGNINIDEKFVASSYACNAEGSQAFLDEASEYSIKDLLKSVIVASANDSAIVLAEGVAGNENNFVQLMNEKAMQLGMTNTIYANSTGLPAMEQYSTAKDTAILLNEVSKYQLYKDYCNIWMDKLVHPSGRETELVNTNRLIKYYTYCKTGKTGFTDEAGYCLSSTANKDNLKLTCVVLGCSNSANRFKESVELYNYAYANYCNQLVLSKEDKVENDIKVIGGKEDAVALVIADDYYLTQSKTNKKSFEIKYNLPTEIKAPLSVGNVVGTAMVVVDGEILKEVEIIVQNSIEKQNYKDVLNKVIDKFGFIN